MKKRVFSFLLSLVMVMTVFAVSAMADAETSQELAVTEETSEPAVTDGEELMEALPEATAETEEPAETPSDETEESAQLATDGAASGTYNVEAARSMLAMINEFRTGSEAWYWNEDDTTKTVYNQDGGVSLQALVYDYDLEEIAKIRAAELVESCSHTRPDGTRWYTATYNGTYSNAENIAWGTSWYYTADRVFEAWQETDEPYDHQGHRRNMLGEYYVAVGIASFEYDGITYWVQEFSYSLSDNVATEPITTPTATPAPTATAKPTATPAPTATAKPTATPAPTATAKPTATPAPTATAKPTATPAPTATAKPTATPAPTATAKPTATPAPTATAKPTATPAPTATPTPTPVPSETVLGDVDGSGIVDLKDVTVLFQYVNGQRSDLPNPKAACLTGSSEPTLKDVTRLFQFVNGQIDKL